jgi:hypothetical protein
MKMWELKTTVKTSRNQWAGSPVTANANSGAASGVNGHFAG